MNELLAKYGITAEELAEACEQPEEVTSNELESTNDLFDFIRRGCEANLDSPSVRKAVGIFLHDPKN